MLFPKIDYTKLHGKQQESFNFYKLSALLVDYGFFAIRLYDDWEGADFIAQHASNQFIKVQLKGRFTLDKKYCDKELYIAFPHLNDWYLYPHDKFFNDDEIKQTRMGLQTNGGFSAKKPSQKILEKLMPYKIGEGINLDFYLQGTYL
jgi:hypothetical protein